MIDKQQLAQRISEVTELTAEERSALLELLNTKKYGLVWEQKTEDVELRLQDELPVLEEVVERRIISSSTENTEKSENLSVISNSQLTEKISTENTEKSENENNNSVLSEFSVDKNSSVDKDCPNHILIEGDNLHALTCLSYTHEGKIDVIYIDPPYNTGNKDFVYNDRYVDSEDSYRHSKWLSFMHKRLVIARRLLSPRGVIFISIDDNEQANLKLLCDEVFGSENFIAQIVWERAYSPVNLKKHFSESHDYILCYANHIDVAVCNGLPRSSDANERYSNPDNDPRGKWKSTDATVGPVVTDKLYEIQLPSGRIVLPPSGRCWVYTKERFQEMVADNRIWFGTQGDSTPSIKKFLSEVKQGMTPMTIWKYTEVGHSQDAAKELKDIFSGESKFSYPKSMRLLKRIVGLYSNPTSTILDFFAGSGTTLHAVMQLNQEDGGHRQCILVTNNENGICEDVTYERNRRVIQGYQNQKGEQIAGLTHNNLRYYRTQFLPREQNHHNRLLLVRAATDLLCIKNDIYDEQPIIIRGKKLRKDIARYFANSSARVAHPMLIVYEPTAIPLLVEWIRDSFTNLTNETNNDLEKLLVYVFSDGRYAYEQDFQEVLSQIELCALPEAIYQAYLRVIGKRKTVHEFSNCQKITCTI